MKTKKSGIVEELKEKYKAGLASAQQEMQENVQPTCGQCCCESDLLLFSKWAYRVGKGWYGFELGRVPSVWTDILNDFLTWVEAKCPDFEIHQIKIKGRGIRIYLGTKTDFMIPDENIRLAISQLQDLLISPHHVDVLEAAPSATAVRKKRQKPSRKP